MYRPACLPGDGLLHPWLGRQIHEPRSGQIQRVLVRPLSARRWRERGSTPLSLNAASGTTTPIEKALLVSRWQSGNGTHRPTVGLR